MAKYDIILVTGHTGATVTQTPVYVTGTTIISGETVITGETITSAITTTFIFSGLTAKYGELLTSGILKFESRFLVGTTNVMIIPKFYKSRPIFEAGYQFIETINYPREFYISFTEEEFYEITPAILFTSVCDYLNTLLNVVAFEITIY
jgi:hypothetical protein